MTLCPSENSLLICRYLETYLLTSFHLSIWIQDRSAEQILESWNAFTCISTKYWCHFKMLYWAGIIDANVNWSLVQHNPSVYWQVYMNKYARIITAQPNMLVICQKSSSTLDSQYSFSKTHFCKLFSNDDIITFWNFCHVLNLKSYDKHVVEEQTKSWFLMTVNNSGQCAAEGSK